MDVTLDSISYIDLTDDTPVGETSEEKYVRYRRHINTVFRDFTYHDAFPHAIQTYVEKIFQEFGSKKNIALVRMSDLMTHIFAAFMNTISKSHGSLGATLVYLIKSLHSMHEPSDTIGMKELLLHYRCKVVSNGQDVDVSDLKQGVHFALRNFVVAPPVFIDLADPSALSQAQCMQHQDSETAKSFMFAWLDFMYSKSIETFNFGDFINSMSGVMAFSSPDATQAYYQYGRTTD